MDSQVGTAKDAPLGARVLKGGLLLAGFLCTGLGVLGIFLPLLPTTPLLLLAAACFARSSERFHRWLLEHRRLGPLIGGYLDGSGIPLKAKVSAIALIWVSVSLSAFLVVPLVWVRFLLFAVALGVSVYLVRLPTRD